MIATNTTVVTDERFIGSDQRADYVAFQNFKLKEKF